MEVRYMVSLVLVLIFVLSFAVIDLIGLIHDNTNR
jgi:hypothetical protein